MADRLTQLQDLVNQQAENFCNAIGILQQFATPSKFPAFDRTGSQTPQQQQQQQQQQQDYAHLFAVQIVRTAKDIDAVIESLPNDESSVELQVNSLRRLEKENQAAAETLRLEVKQGEIMHGKIQLVLSDIAQFQLGLQDRNLPPEKKIDSTENVTVKQEVEELDSQESTSRVI